MEQKVTKEKLLGKDDRNLRVLDGGKRPDGTIKDRVGHEPISHRRRRFVPAKELAELLADAPSIDYEQLRADLDAVVDPSPKDWYAWAARTDRHIRRGALERD